MLPRLVSRVARARVFVAPVSGVERCARFFSAKGDEGQSTADITKFFLENDSKVVAAKASSLPASVRVSGRTGELLGELYTAGTAGKNFDKIVKDLEAFTGAVKSSGLVVERFFSSANYSPAECAKVVELLLTAKEPLTSFKDIKDAEVREVLVDNEGNMDAWRGARKAVAALNLSEPVKALLDTLAKDGHLERVKKLAGYASELASVSSKTVNAVVTSAVPLTKAQQDAVVKALPTYAKDFPAGTNVVPVFAVDTAVVGGLTVTIKNTSIDLSANSRLVEVVAAA